MDILKDIANILKKQEDMSHLLEIKIAWDGVSIYLDDDPCRDFEQKYIIPIKYDVVDDIIYIPDSEYRQLFKSNETGINYTKIIIIKDIMDYLNSHKEEITDLCNLYDFETRYDKED